MAEGATERHLKFRHFLPYHPGMGLRKSAAAAGESSALADRAEIDAILGARAGRKPGRLYKRESAIFLDGFADEKAKTDPTAMSATFWISRPNVDRSEDIVNPLGLDLTNYRLNPICFFDHALGGLDLPIGKSEDPNGNLSISCTADGVLGTCYFSQTLPEGEQIFELVDEGILRAASPYIRELKCSIRPGTGTGRDRPGLYIEQWDMCEWSVVGIPDNQQAVAVRKVFDRGRLAGRPIAEAIKKSLRAYAAAIPVQGRGFNLPEQTIATPAFTLASILTPTQRPTIMSMAKSLRKSHRKDAADGDPEGEEKRRKAKEFEDRDDVKALTKEYSDIKDSKESEHEKRRKEIEDEYKRLRKDAGLTDDDDQIPTEPGQGRETKEEHREPDGDEATPLGAQILGAAYNALCELADQMEEAGKPLENPAVKDYMGSMTDALRGHMSDMKDLHKSEYPDHPELGKGLDEEGEEGSHHADEPGEPTRLEKFLARSKIDRQGVKGIGLQLMKMSEARVMPKKFRDQLAQLSRRLGGIGKRAEQKSVTAISEDQAAELAAVKKEFAELKAALQEAMPVRRN